MPPADPAHKTTFDPDVTVTRQGDARVTRQGGETTKQNRLEHTINNLNAPDERPGAATNQAPVVSPGAVSLREAAEKLGVSVATLRRAYRSGKLEAEQVAGPRGPEYRIDLNAARQALSTPATATFDPDVTVTRQGDARVTRHRQGGTATDSVVLPAAEWRALLTRIDTHIAETTAARERAARAEADAQNARERARAAETERDQARGHLIELERSRAAAEGRAEALAAALTTRAVEPLALAAPSSDPAPEQQHPATDVLRRLWSRARKK